MASDYHSPPRKRRRLSPEEEGTQAETESDEHDPTALPEDSQKALEVVKELANVVNERLQNKGPKTANFSIRKRSNQFMVTRPEDKRVLGEYWDPRLQRWIYPTNKGGCQLIWDSLPQHVRDIVLQEGRVPLAPGLFYWPATCSQDAYDATDVATQNVHTDAGWEGSIVPAKGVSGRVVLFPLVGGRDCRMLFYDTEKDPAKTEFSYDKSSMTEHFYTNGTVFPPFDFYTQHHAGRGPKTHCEDRLVVTIIAHSRKAIDKIGMKYLQHHGLTAKQARSVVEWGLSLK